MIVPYYEFRKMVHPLSASKPTETVWIQLEDDMNKCRWELRDIAEDDRAKTKFNDNQFRYTTTLTPECGGFFYEIVLTDLGEKAMALHKQKIIFDQLADPDWNATTYFWTSNQRWRLHQKYFLSLDEEWAEPIQSFIMEQILLRC